MLFLMRNRKDIPGPGMAEATVDSRKAFGGTMDEDGTGCLSMSLVNLDHGIQNSP